VTPHPLPDNTRENSLKILGVTLTYNLSASDHIRGVTSDCAQTQYALRVLRSHGQHRRPPDHPPIRSYVEDTLCLDCMERLHLSSGSSACQRISAPK